MRVSIVPERDLPASAGGVPYIRANTPTFQAFGDADLATIYGDKIKTAKVVAARELRSMVFLNRGGKFEARPLPVEAQWAPAFGVSVADFDGDGRVDLVVAQSNDQTKLLHNVRAKPGLRVKLEGAKGNPHCVGAIVRAKTAAGLGRAQMVTVFSP